jgi:hypothetical protein
MQNIIPPYADDIKIYDLKGSTVHRQAFSINDSDTHGKIGKDIDFLNIE